MKAPAFQWYAADYLSNERVLLLSIAAEGVYVRLLSHCWQEGSVPSNPVACAPFCKYADMKDIKAALALFVKSPDKPGRLIHTALEEQRAKHEIFRSKQAAKGIKGGRPKKPIVNPEESHGKATGLQRDNTGKATVNPDESSYTSIETDTEIKSESLQASKQVSASQPVYFPEEAPVFKVSSFFAYVDSIGYAQVDKGLYLTQMQKKAESLKRQNTNADWEKFILTYLNNDKRDKKLLLPDKEEKSPEPVRVANPYKHPSDLWRPTP